MGFGALNIVEMDYFADASELCMSSEGIVSNFDSRINVGQVYRPVPVVLGSIFTRD